MHFLTIFCSIFTTINLFEMKNHISKDANQYLNKRNEGIKYFILCSYVFIMFFL